MRMSLRLALHGQTSSLDWFEIDITGSPAVAAKAACSRVE